MYKIKNISMKSMKTNILHRLKIIKGHVNAIEKMVDEDKYCVDIVHQSMAVQRALKKMDMQIIEDHIRNCTISQIKEGKEEDAVKELIDIYNLK